MEELSGSGVVGAAVEFGSPAGGGASREVILQCGSKSSGMIKADINGAEIAFTYIDNGKPETVVFSNSLGTTMAMWDKQIEPFSQHFNVLLSDTRGHGESEVTEGDYSAELLGKDILGLTAELGLESFHFCGLSMGGTIGQWLALYGGPRVDRVALCNTAVKIGTKEGWNERIATVREVGLGPVAESTPPKWFSDAFLEDRPGEVARIVEDFLKNSPAGYCANCAMVRDADFTDEIEKVAKPVLIVAGTIDPVTTVKDGEYLREKIAGSELVALEARHLSAYEKNHEFNRALLSFLQR